MIEPAAKRAMEAGAEVSVFLYLNPRSSPASQTASAW